MLSDFEIQKLCKKYSMDYTILIDKVFIRTDKAEWYFDRYDDSDNIKLHHCNYLFRGNNNKFNQSYHIQKRRFSSQHDIFKYIYNHDRKVYNKKVKKCRMEYLFEKIEAESRVAASI